MRTGESTIRSNKRHLASNICSRTYGNRESHVDSIRKKGKKKKKRNRRSWKIEDENDARGSEWNEQSITIELGPSLSRDALGMATRVNRPFAQGRGAAIPRLRGVASPCLEESGELWKLGRIIFQISRQFMSSVTFASYSLLWSVDCVFFEKEEELKSKPEESYSWKMIRPLIEIFLSYCFTLSSWK